MKLIRKLLPAIGEVPSHHIIFFTEEFNGENLKSDTFHLFNTAEFRGYYGRVKRDFETYKQVGYLNKQIREQIDSLIQRDVEPSKLIINRVSFRNLLYMQPRHDYHEDENIYLGLKVIESVRGQREDEVLVI